MTEKELALELEFVMRKNGADSVSFDTILASGERSAMAHATVTEKKIPDNTFVLIDFGCKYKGYCSDMTRMVKIGEPDEKWQRMYDIVKKAQTEALKAVKAGVRASEIDKIARDIIKDSGFGKNFTHSTGHGVGLEIHENPRISKNSDFVLQENMVITVEPGIYVEGLGGIRVEDMVCVKQEGCVNYSIEEK